MTDTTQKLETYPFVVDHDVMLSGMGSFGWRIATSEEHVPMMDLAEELLGSELVPAETIKWINSVTKMTSWVFGDPLEGIFIVLPITMDGLDAIHTGDFKPGAPEEHFLAAPGELCAGIYVGAYAGSTKPARKAVMMATAILRVQIYGQVPCFARAATDDGARTMASLGYHPTGFGADKLWMQAPIHRPEQKVA